MKRMFATSGLLLAGALALSPVAAHASSHSERGYSAHHNRNWNGHQNSNLHRIRLRLHNRNNNVAVARHGRSGELSIPGLGIPGVGDGGGGSNGGGGNGGGGNN